MVADNGSRTRAQSTHFITHHSELTQLNKNKDNNNTIQMEQYNNMCVYVCEPVGDGMYGHTAARTQVKVIFWILSS